MEEPDTVDVSVTREQVAAASARLVQELYALGLPEALGVPLLAYALLSTAIGSIKRGIVHENPKQYLLDLVAKLWDDTEVTGDAE